MYGPRLNKILNLKNCMPLESFKLLARKNAASNLVVGTSSRNDPVGDSAAGLKANVAEESSGLVKEKERKRHRDGGSSKHHHHKKPKDSSQVVLVEDSEQSKKKGVEPRGVEVTKSIGKEDARVVDLISKDVTVLDSVCAKFQSLSLCKDYASKVLWFIFLSFLVLFCSFPFFFCNFPIFFEFSCILRYLNTFEDCG